MSYNIPASEEPNMEELMQKGWNSMSNILDQEMPQKNKKRYFILWFTAGSLLLLSAGAYFGLQTKGTGQGPIDKFENVPAATQQSAPQASVPQKDNKMEAASIVQLNAPLRNTTKGLTRQGMYKQEATVASVTLEGNEMPHSIQPAEAQELNNETAIQTSTEESILEHTNVADREAFSSIAAIPTLEPAALSTDFPNLDFKEHRTIQPASTVKPKIKTRHQLLMDAGVTQSMLSNKSGIQVGLSYGWSFSKQMRLSVGLAYGFQFTPIQSLSAYNYDEAEPILNKSASSELLRSNFNTKYHQIRVPISLLYQFHSRWAVQGGMSLIYDRPIINVQKSTERLSNTSPSFSDFTDINYPMVNSFSVGLDAGLQYRLSKHFSLRSGILYNALPISNRELFKSQKSRHWEANLGVQYKF